MVFREDIFTPVIELMAQLEIPFEKFLEKQPGKFIFVYGFGADDTLPYVQRIKLTQVRPERHITST